MATTAPADFKTFQDRKSMNEEKPAECFTMFSNVFLDEFLARIKSLAELKITMVVIRKTIGYQKTTDQISVSQFVKATGLSKQSVLDGIDLAIKNGLITREPRGQYFIYSLKLVKNLDQLVEDTVKTGKEFRPVPVKNLDQLDAKLVKNLDPQKKGLKENIKKDKTTTLVVAPPPEKSVTIDLVETVFFQEKEPEPIPVPTPIKPKPKAQPKEPNPHIKHPAILIWQTTHNKKLPTIFQMDVIAEKIGDDPERLDEWRECLSYWAKNPRWNQTNLNTIFDCFDKQSYKKGDNYGQGRNSQSRTGTNGASSTQGAGNNGRFIGKNRNFGQDGRLTDEQLQNAW